MRLSKVCTLIYVLLLSIGGNFLFAQPALKKAFHTLPEESRPWTFWYWMYGAVSREGITADLEAMKEIGLGGAYLMPIKSSSLKPEYGGKADQLTEDWWNMIRFSVKESDRLGLKLGMHICDGFALAGGPWITSRESMQKVVWADTIVNGGNLKLSLPMPESYKGYYEDIALYAIPVEKVESVQQPIVTVVNLETTPTDRNKIVNIDKKEVIRSSYPCYIQYVYDHPFTCRGVEIILGGNNYQAHRLKVMASEDGIHYRLVKQLTPARQGWQNTDENTTYSLPAVTAKYFRFYWTPVGSEPGSEDLDAAKWKPNLKIKELKLHSKPCINSIEGKAGLVWRIAEDTDEREVSQSDCISKEDVIDLTGNLLGGVLKVTLPKGRWKLLRMGHTSTGHENATGGTGKGLECDKFSEQAVRKQFDHWFGEFFRKIEPELAHRVIRFMHVDSWECGSQNWSDNFVEEFKTRRGYDLMPYLPLLAGIPMESASHSEQVLRDVRTTIGELVNDVFYRVLADCAQKYRCEFSAECVAPTMVSDGLLHYSRVDRPMGEFWLNSPTHDKLNDMLDAISGAHIYGKKLVQAEGFTEIRGVWDEHPAILKPLLDRNYALGINKLFFHVYAHNPWVDRKPGMTLDGIGLFFQRGQTWWKEGKAFVDYVSRCQALLQYGVPVVDIAVFTGEEMPRRAILPERLVSMLPGLIGEKRVVREKKRIANLGQPLRVKPVGVSHSANMADPEDWINPLNGYAYDSFNKDVLLRLAKVDNGCIVLPGGGKYRVLVLPGKRLMDPNGVPFSVEVEKKLDEFRKAGVFMPTLPYSEADFSSIGLERDVILPENVAYTHRSGDEAEIYFIANQKDEERSFVASFRITGRKPQLWNAVTGEIIEAENWKEVEGRTEVEMSLTENASLFVVFAKEPVRADKPMKITDKVSMKFAQWRICFEETGQIINSDTLFDWTTHHDNAVRYYSGRVVYTTSFKVKKKAQEKVMLDLGKVSNLAGVWINDIYCGTVWISPYRLDVTKALKKGKNTLRIEVVNTWANALLGVEQGKAPFGHIWTNGNYRRAEKSLLPAGLEGPLQLEYYKIDNTVF